MEECELLELTPAHRSVDDSIIEERIDAGYGPILVAQQGVRYRPNSSQCCIVTFHDLGLNYLSNFQAFFNYHLMVPVISRMPVFHINAPGQEDGANNLAENYTYPTMAQLADSVRTVCNYYNITQAICIGVGLGANVMARVAANNPDIVDGLFLINPVPTTAGWIEWAYQKRNIYYLTNLDSGLSQLAGDFGTAKGAFPQCVIDYLLWHHFGASVYRNADLINMYKSFFSSRKLNPKNLALLIESYIRRDDLGIQRESNKVDCSSLILCGNDSPFLDDSINMNQRLQADRSTWMKLFDCGLPLDEEPGKVSEAFILFTQGLGLGLLTCYKYK